MKPICALCGRPTKPFVMIGREAIGPKCAAKAGLLPKSWRNSRLKFIKPAKLESSGQGDLFADQKESND
jgi:hypothetical protein